jgi:hypothetical protein
MTSTPGPDGAAVRPTDRPVFISHSSDDHAVGQKVCRFLEQEGIPCWMAPRNIQTGRDYGEQIIDAIESSLAMVMLLSNNANASIFVPKEVERAVSKGKTVFVLRIEDVAPSRGLELFISHRQWVDAWAPPLKARVHVLAEAIRGLESLAPVAGPKPQPRPSRYPRWSVLGLGLVGIGLVAVAMIALISGFLPFGSRGPGSLSASPTVPVSHNASVGEPGFYSTGSMSSVRTFQTATLLADGDVLIAGGADNSGTALASAELYDPKTGTFKATGSMTHARFGQTSTLLADGDVLIAGGWDGSAAISSAELYDPTTGTFRATGSMIAGRQTATATLLHDGSVLVAGGWDGAEALPSAELYDPTTGTFSTTGALAQARVWHTATLLPDGRVIVVGGHDTSGTPLASAEIYDPTTGLRREERGRDVNNGVRFGRAVRPEGRHVQHHWVDGRGSQLAYGHAASERPSPHRGRGERSGIAARFRRAIRPCDRRFRHRHDDRGSGCPYGDAAPQRTGSHRWRNRRYGGSRLRRDIPAMSSRSASAATGPGGPIGRPSRSQGYRSWLTRASI